MPISRAQKADNVQALNAMLQDNESVIVLNPNGLTVAENTDLRIKLRAEGASLKFTKNRLMTRALKDTSFEGLEPLFTGITAVAVSKDPVAAAKVTYNYAKENNKLSILGGALGSKILNISEVEALAQLPSLDEVRGTLVGLLQAPAVKVARVLQAPAQALVGVTAAYGRTEG